MKIGKEQENEIRYEEEKTLKRRIEDYLVITVASAIYAVSVSLFLDPNSLAPGGVTGIAIILNRLTGLETGTWMFLINIPILALGCGSSVGSSSSLRCTVHWPLPLPPIY